MTAKTMTLREIFLKHIQAEKTVIHEFSGDWDADYKRLESELVFFMNQHLDAPLTQSDWLEDWEWPEREG